MANWLVWILVIVVGLLGLAVGSPGEPDCAGVVDRCGSDFHWQPVITDGVKGVIVPERDVPDLTN